MPALPNRRQELFCLKVAQGIPPYRAYPEAGYKPDQGHPYRLMAENGRVKQRLLELTGTAEVQELASRDRILAELASVGYSPIGGPDVKVTEKTNALMGMARIAGLLIDRKEIGSAGDFAKLDEHELDNIITATYSEITLLEGDVGESPDEEAVSSEEEEG
jgi:hypothetical protein